MEKSAILATGSSLQEGLDEEIEQSLTELEILCGSPRPQVYADAVGPQVEPERETQSNRRPPKGEGDSPKQLIGNVIQGHFEQDKAPGAADPCKESRYPALPIPEMEGGHPAVVDELSKLAERYRKERDYPAVREEYLVLSFLLNQHGLIAPAYRDQPKILPYEKNAELLVDQIVIDCHWLWVRNEVVRPKWLSLERIFSCREAFDCDYISAAFAGKDWTSEFRIEQVLKLNVRQQLQLRQLRTAALKNRYVQIVDGLGKKRSDPLSTRQPALILPIRRAILDWAMRRHQVAGHEDVYEALWVARELLGPGARLGHIAELTSLQLGTSRLSRKTVSEKLARLDEQLLKQGVTPGTGVAA